MIQRSHLPRSNLHLVMFRSVFICSKIAFVVLDLISQHTGIIHNTFPFREFFRNAFFIV